MKRMFNLLLCVFITLGSIYIPVSAEDTSLYITAEDFIKSIGTWVYTNPESDKSGAGVLPYLKSPKPPQAESAFVSFNLPADGEYYIYAFTRDYSTSSGSRRFKISINNNVIPRNFGTNGTDGWAWEAGGSMNLKKGTCTIELIDSSRNFGRIMAIVLTTDSAYKGPETKEDLEKAFSDNHAEVLDHVVIPEPVPDEPVKEEPLYIPENIPVKDSRPSDDIAVKLNNKYLVFNDDSKPFVENSRTLVPFRAIFEALGLSVSWNSDMQTAIGIRDNVSISLPVGNQLAEVSGESVYLDQPAVLKNSRVMVPIRFVAESLGSTVGWDAESKTVVIYADIPKTSDLSGFLFLPSSFSDLGTWASNASGGGSFDSGVLTGGSGGNPQNTIPAKAYFNVTEKGTYKIWVRSKDYATNQPGTRFFNVAINGTQLAPTFGTHGKEGFFWTDGGNIKLNEGTNLLELLDTADFFGRCDAVVITKDISGKEPSSSLEILQKSFKNVKKAVVENSIKFPSYASEQNAPTATESIENEHLKVDFYTVNTSGGTVIQNRISYKKDGTTVVTKERTEDFGFILLAADTAQLKKPLLNRQIFSSTYTDFYGNAKQYYGANIYRAANVYHLIPNSVTVSDNKAYLGFENDIADFTVVWYLNGKNSVVEATAVFKESGNYSVGITEGGEIPATKITNPDEIIADPGLISFGTEGLYITNSGILKGVRTETESGISLRGPGGNFRATAFYPVLGTNESYKNAGDSLSFTCSILSSIQ